MMKANIYCKSLNYWKRSWLPTLLFGFLGGCSPSSGNESTPQPCDSISSICPTGQVCDFSKKQCIAVNDASLNDSSNDAPVTPTGCTNDDSCGNSKPICSSGVCRGCSTDFQCESKYPNDKTYCSNGACVQCTTNAQCTKKTPNFPICEQSTCNPAIRNFQCPNSAADEGGGCHDLSRIIYVDDHDLDPNVDCDKLDPKLPPCTVQSVQKAIDILGVRGRDLIFIKKPKGAAYQTGNPIKISKSVRIVGERAKAEDASLAILRDPIVINGNISASDVRIEDVRIVDANSHGINCSRKKETGMSLGEPVQLKLWYSTIENSTKVGLLSDQCNVDSTANLIVRNQEAGAQISSGKFNFFNTIIAVNGTQGANQVGGFQISNALENSVFSFNTVVDNTGDVNGYNLTCLVSGMTPPPLPIFQYSIVLGSATKPLGMGCLIKNSVVPSDLVNPTNKNISDVPVFVRRTDADKANVDVHLKVDDTANDRLRINYSEVPKEVRPGYDIDSQVRNLHADGMTYIGADHIP